MSELLSPSAVRVGAVRGRYFAAQLFLAVGTVALTLNRVSRKLDVKSRRDLPAALAKDGDGPSLIEAGTGRGSAS